MSTHNSEEKKSEPEQHPSKESHGTPNEEHEKGVHNESNRVDGAVRVPRPLEKADGITEKFSDANARIADATIEAAKAAIESAKANRMMVWVTIGLLVVTAVQAFYTNQSLKQSESAITATVEASRLDQRAWVGPNLVRLEPMTAGQPIKVAIVYTNTGKTPANKAIAEVFMRTSPNGALSAEEIIRDARSAGHKPKGIGTVFPDEKMTTLLSLKTPAQTAEIESIKAERVTIYVVGIIHYVDIAGRDRVTRFFYRYSPVDGGVVSEYTHNDAN